MKIFVFGSNLAGRHGAGAALFARQNRGAIYGQGWGLQGTSYGIPTKDADLKPLPLEDIAVWARGFVYFAALHSELEFELTRVGCGRAKYTDAQIAPLFRGVPSNCQTPPEWSTWL